MLLTAGELDFTFGGGDAEDPDFLVARVTADGRLDATFAGDGVAEVALPQAASLADVAVQPSGRVVTVGAAPYVGLRGTD